MHAVFVTARRVYIVTELVTGGELLDMCVFILSRNDLFHVFVWGHHLETLATFQLTW